MTFFGKNIKKIRSIQKLSQSGFAEIFGLSRASIGAYEEGRAEAKLDIIIKIANYFSITVDELINKEITVNELYHFNIFDENISGKSILSSEILKKLDFNEIPLIVTHELLVKDLNSCGAESINFITLPHLSNQHIAVLISRDGFKYIPNEISNDDIVIVFSDFVIEKETSLTDRVWFIKISKSLFIGEIKRLDKKTFLFFPNDSSPVNISVDDIDFILPLETLISKNPCFNSSNSNKLRKLEIQINDLYNRI